MEKLIQAYEPFLIWLSAGSLLLFLGSLAALPWLVGRLPRDYFLTCGKKRGGQGLGSLAAGLVRNLFGLALLLMGILMLFVPGQGLLTMVAGLLVMEFPGKSRLMLWVTGFARIRQGLNWLRQKQGKAGLKFPVGGQRDSDSPEIHG